VSIRESRFNKLFREHLEKEGFKFDRIESHTTSPGVPDNAFLHSPTRLSGWIEVKEVEWMPIKVAYRPRQSSWLEEHWRKGGNSMTIVHIKQEKSVVIVAGNRSFSAEKELNKLLTSEDSGVRIVPVVFSLIAKTVIDFCNQRITKEKK
jgi:hypothetical protein